MGLQLQHASVSSPFPDLAITHQELRDMGILSEHVLGTHEVCKRLVDITVALLCIVALSPLLILLAVLVKVTSPGPIIYPSLRIGRNQKPFYIRTYAPV